jgi:hypothetical protein
MKRTVKFISVNHALIIIFMRGKDRKLSMFASYLDNSKILNIIWNWIQNGKLPEDYDPTRTTKVPRK